MEAWKHLRAIVLLPFMVTVVIPGMILLLTGPDTFGLWESVAASRVALPIVGLHFIVLGLVLMVGKGTLAPWNPTPRLVVQGIYRHVRNPMISGVFFVLLGGVRPSGVVATFLLVRRLRHRGRRLHPTG